MGSINLVSDEGEGYQSRIRWPYSDEARGGGGGRRASNSGRGRAPVHATFTPDSSELSSRSAAERTGGEKIGRGGGNLFPNSLQLECQYSALRI